MIQSSRATPIAAKAVSAMPWEYPSLEKYGHLSGVNIRSAEKSSAQWS